MRGWGWRGWGPDIAPTTVITYRVGTLVLDMYDAHNKELIFRGIASDTPGKNPKGIYPKVIEEWKA